MPTNLPSGRELIIKHQYLKTKHQLMALSNGEQVKDLLNVLTSQGKRLEPPYSLHYRATTLTNWLQLDRTGQDRVRMLTVVKARVRC